MHRICGETDKVLQDGDPVTLESCGGGVYGTLSL